MSSEEQDSPPSLLYRVASIRNFLAGWVLDAFRLPWVILSLNLSKSIWILRGRRGVTAPCQNGSDSGLAGRTHCDAASVWRKRSRLCRVCPHLVCNAKNEWVCSSDAKNVKTFWGRGAALVIGPLVACWLLAVVCLWALVWKSGARVGIDDIALPTRWGNITRARSEVFRRQAAEAFGAGKYQQAVVNLTTALSINPDNFEARLTYANLLWLEKSSRDADHQFALMLTKFPDRMPEVGRVWLPKLMVLGRFSQARELSLGLLEKDLTSQAAWLHALIFSAKMTKDAPVLVRAAQNVNLPPVARAILTAHAAAIAGQRETAARLFDALVPSGTWEVFTHYQKVEGLLDIKEPVLALAALQASNNKLPESEVLTFMLRAYAQRNYPELVQGTIRESFRKMDLPRLTAVVAYLVRHHDREGVLRVISMMQEAPVVVQLQPPLASLYLAVGLWGDRDLLPAVADLAVNKAKMSRASLERFDATANEPGRLNEAMAQLPLPIEVVYAVQSSLAETAAARAASPTSGGGTSSVRLNRR
jgi:tetratricopeptide (TPR) repeat protein